MQGLITPVGGGEGCGAKHLHAWGPARALPAGASWTEQGVHPWTLHPRSHKGWRTCRALLAVGGVWRVRARPTNPPSHVVPDVDMHGVPSLMHS